MLLLVSNHELSLGGDLGSALGVDGGGAGVVDVGAGGVFEAFVDGLRFGLGRAGAVGGGEDLEGEGVRTAGGDGGAARGEGEAFTLREGVAGAVAEAEAVGALVLGEGAGRGGGTGGSGGEGRGGAGGSGGAGGRGSDGSLGGFGVAGDGGDEALILAVFDADVTFLTPLGGPGVLDDPVGSGVGQIVANNKHAMINLSRCTVGHDASGVGLPSGSVDGDGERSNVGDGGGHGGFGVGNVDVAGDVGAGGLAGAVARGDLTVTRDVRVVGFTSHVTVPVLDDSGPGVVHETAVAAVVAGVAGDEFLFGEGDEVVAGEEPLAFGGTSCGERPAGAALALVLDVGDGTLLAPVDLFDLGGTNEGLLGAEAGALGFGLVEVVGVVVDLEFFGREVGELVVAEGSEGVLGGEGVGDAHVFSVDLFALGILIGSEGLVVQLLVFRPRRVGKGHLDGEGDGDADSGEAGVENLHDFFLFKRRKRG